MVCCRPGKLLCPMLLLPGVARSLLTGLLPRRLSRGLGSSLLRMAAAEDSLAGGSSATKLPAVDPSRPRPLLLESLASAPDSPGVYIMEGAGGAKLYIGKSVRLSSRVPSYFSTGAAGDDGSVLPGGNLSRRIAVMTTLVER